MANSEELNEFATQIRQEIIAIIEAEGNDRLYPEAFTQYVIDYLVDAGILEDGKECHYKAIGIEV
ncbi:MAG: hypothetical protein H0V70_04285, partial [Ktedonobacteraceae bacterium]|nr:hypothetical protein [Ktedonobacteraceae bacterium]